MVKQRRNKEKNRLSNFPWEFIALIALLIVIVAVALYYGQKIGWNSNNP